MSADKLSADKLFCLPNCCLGEVAPAIGSNGFAVGVRRDCATSTSTCEMLLKGTNVFAAPQLNPLQRPLVRARCGCRLPADANRVLAVASRTQFFCQNFLLKELLSVLICVPYLFEDKVLSSSVTLNLFSFFIR